MHSKQPSRQNQHTTDMLTSVRNKVTTQIGRAKSNVFVNVTRNARCIWTNIKNLTENNTTNKNVRELQINGNLTHVSNEIATALNTPVHKSNLQCLCGLKNSKAKDAFHMDTVDESDAPKWFISVDLIRRKFSSATIFNPCQYIVWNVKKIHAQISEFFTHEVVIYVWHVLRDIIIKYCIIWLHYCRQYPEVYHKMQNCTVTES